ncbi:hypothetical protein ACFQY5_32420 [Paeniroseomonas aquatica]|uniref:hypothetical protein n=1 Tax=Paeniroseomonas aquatica TaxID=373043 RepID=UPI0036172093
MAGASGTSEGTGTGGAIATGGGAGGAACWRSCSSAGISGPWSSRALTPALRSAARRTEGGSSTSWSWFGTIMPPGDSGRIFTGRASGSISGTVRGPMREMPQPTAPATATAPSRPPATASIRQLGPGFSGRARQDGIVMSLTASPRRA